MPADDSQATQLYEQLETIAPWSLPFVLAGWVDQGLSLNPARLSDEHLTVLIRVFRNQVLPEIQSVQSLLQQFPTGFRIEGSQQLYVESSDRLEVDISTIGGLRTQIDEMLSAATGPEGRNGSE